MESRSSTTAAQNPDGRRAPANKDLPKSCNWRHSGQPCTSPENPGLNKSVSHVSATAFNAASHFTTKRSTRDRTVQAQDSYCVLKVTGGAHIKGHRAPHHSKPAAQCTKVGKTTPPAYPVNCRQQPCAQCSVSTHKCKHVAPSHADAVVGCEHTRPHDRNKTAYPLLPRTKPHPMHSSIHTLQQQESYEPLPATPLCTVLAAADQNPARAEAGQPARKAGNAHSFIKGYIHLPPLHTKTRVESCDGAVCLQC